MTTEQNELADWRGTFPGQTAGDVIKILAKEQAEKQAKVRKFMEYAKGTGALR